MNMVRRFIGILCIGLCFGTTQFNVPLIAALRGMLFLVGLLCILEDYKLKE